jgi:hypothetical protein
MDRRRSGPTAPTRAGGCRFRPGSAREPRREPGRRSRPRRRSTWSRSSRRCCSPPPRPPRPARTDTFPTLRPRSSSSTATRATPHASCPGRIDLRPRPRHPIESHPKAGCSSTRSAEPIARTWPARRRPCPHPRLGARIGTTTTARSFSSRVRHSRRSPRLRGWAPGPAPVGSPALARARRPGQRGAPSRTHVQGGDQGDRDRSAAHRDGRAL